VSLKCETHGLTIPRGRPSEAAGGGPRAVLHLQGYVAIERVRSTPGDKDLGDGQERPPSCKQRVAATAANAIQPLLALIDFAY
jgi:hypothetical protein